MRIDVNPRRTRVTRAIEQRRQLLETLRAGNDVDAGVAAQQRVAFLLRDAAGHRDEWTIGPVRR